MHVGLDWPGLPASPEKPEAGLGACRLLALKGWAVSTSKSEGAKHSALQAVAQQAGTAEASRPWHPLLAAGGPCWLCPEGKRHCRQARWQLVSRGRPAWLGLGTDGSRSPSGSPRRAPPACALCQARSVRALRTMQTSVATREHNLLNHFT